MTKTEIENAWYDFLRGALPEKWAIVFAEQSTPPRVRLPYLTLKLISGGGNQTIDSDLRQEEIDGEIEFRNVRQLNYSLSIQSYGSGGMDVMNDIKASLDDVVLREILRGADIGGIQPQNPIDITAALPAQFEERCSLDILFHSSHNKVTNVGYIETVNISGELESDKTININQTIEG